MSQIELAEFLDVNPTTVCSWESYSEMPKRRDSGFLRAFEVLRIP